MNMNMKTNKYQNNNDKIDSKFNEDKLNILDIGQYPENPLNLKTITI